MKTNFVYLEEDLGNFLSSIMFICSKFCDISTFDFGFVIYYTFKVRHKYSVQADCF